MIACYIANDGASYRYNILDIMMKPGIELVIELLNETVIELVM